jgi:alpha-1,2-mannosyltransferase
VWLTAGIVVFALVVAGYLLFVTSHPEYRWTSPVDLRVYRDAGLIVRGLPPYNPHLAAPLYDWRGFLGFRFTYPPFAALVFTALTLPAWAWLPNLSIAVNILALVATIWVTLGALGYRAADTRPAAGRLSGTRLGGTLLIAGAVFWTEPVQRTLYLGQIELLLMALILWDMLRPGRPRWQGIGVGIAAGIKLVPLIFIPYLLLTHRYRQAAVAAGTFTATVLLGFIVLPADSRSWWLDGLFLRSGRTGFVGWEGNQSLQALITRLSGSIAAGRPAWLVAAVLALVAGLAAAVVLDRCGQPVLGVLTCALTGLLISPISWDHHWVWIVPIITVLAVFGVRAAGLARWTCVAGAGLVALIFGAWPVFLWGQSPRTSGFSMGLIWAAPHSNPGNFAVLGDRRWYVEYHWRGVQILAGNLYVLTGLALFALMVIGAAAMAHGGWAPPGLAPASGTAPSAVRGQADQAQGRKPAEDGRELSQPPGCQRSVMPIPSSASMRRSSGRESPMTAPGSPSMPSTNGAPRPSMLNPPARACGSPVAM